LIEMQPNYTPFFTGKDAQSLVCVSIFTDKSDFSPKCLAPLSVHSVEGEL